MAIGIQYIPRGFLAVGWLEAIKATGAKHPERKMDALQLLVWEDVVLPLWYVRNNILHRGTNKNNERECKQLTEKITWYLDQNQNACGCTTLTPLARRTRMSAAN